MTKPLLIPLLFLLLGASAHGRMRIVSLTPATTEILFALGVGDEVEGVSSLCSFPPEARTKTKVGTFSRPNMEIILTLKPDLVIATGLEQGPAVHELRRLGLNVLVSHPASIQELFDSILEIGHATGREAPAKTLVEKMRRDIDETTSLAQTTPPERRPTVFVELWDKPLMTAGKGSFIDELVQLAGGVNIAADAPRPYSLFSPEVVLHRNPDCILLTTRSAQPPLERVQNRFAWGGLSAVINHRVYGDIDPDLILRPGPRLAEGLRELQKRITP